MAAFIIVITTICYASLMYRADKVDRGLVFEKIQSAYNDGQLLAKDEIPPFSRGLGSRDNLSGIDQLVESFYALMVMYQDKEHPWMNALNPGLYQTVDNKLSSVKMATSCISASQTSLNDPNVWTVQHKPRLWHGVKALLLFGFQYLELAQITWLIKISTFFAFAIIGSQIMYLNQQVGLAYMAYNLAAFYCSSIFFFGGVAYSVPLLSVAVWGILWLAYKMLPWKFSRTTELTIITFGGTVHSFFFQLGGSEIYVLSFIIFVETFLPRDRQLKENLKNVGESCIFFLIGFFGSIILKHVVIVCLTGSLDVINELMDKILYRTSNINDSGTKIGLIDIISSQFHWYGIAAYGITAIHMFVNASQYISLGLITLVSLWLATLKYLKQNSKFEELALVFIGFLLMLATVILRYMVLRNHSDIHVIFVNRYLFVYAGTVYFFAVYLMLSFRRFIPDRRHASPT